MIRGTTAQFKFKLPYRADELDLVTITFWQPNSNDPYLPIRKVRDQCSVPEEDSYCLCVSLTPAETMRFSDQFKARVQLRAERNGTFFASRQELITVYPINDENIDTEFPEPDKEGWVILDGEKITES